MGGGGGFDSEVERIAWIESRPSLDSGACPKSMLFIFHCFSPVFWGTGGYHLLFGLGPEEDVGDLGEVSELEP